MPPQALKVYVDDEGNPVQAKIRVDDDGNPVGVAYVPQEFMGRARASATHPRNDTPPHEPETYWGGFLKGAKEYFVGKPDEASPLMEGLSHLAHPQSVGDVAGLLLPTGVPSLGRTALRMGRTAAKYAEAEPAVSGVAGGLRRSIRGAMRGLVKEAIGPSPPIGFEPTSRAGPAAQLPPRPPLPESPATWNRAAAERAAMETQVGEIPVDPAVADFRQATLRVAPSSTSPAMQANTSDAWERARGVLSTEESLAGFEPTIRPPTAPARPSGISAADRARLIKDHYPPELIDRVEQALKSTPASGMSFGRGAPPRTVEPSDLAGIKTDLGREQVAQTMRESDKALAAQQAAGGGTELTPQQKIVLAQRLGHPAGTGIVKLAPKGEAALAAFQELEGGEGGIGALRAGRAAGLTQTDAELLSKASTPGVLPPAAVQDIRQRVTALYGPNPTKTQWINYLRRNPKGMQAALNHFQADIDAAPD